MVNQKIIEIIEANGNSFHYKVVDFLRKEGWHVLVSPYYADNFSEKPREIDIIAEKNFAVSESPKFLGTINIQLFIECKYIIDDTVFWFDEKNIKETIRLVEKSPLKETECSLTPGKHNHHYLNDPLVAKLFASSPRSNSSPDGEVFYKATTQSLNGMIAYKNNGSILPNYFNGFKNNNVTLIKYPVIVCNSFDKLYKYDVITKTEPDKISENFQIETQYAYFDHTKKPQNEFFLIDVCGLPTLKDYIEILENDVRLVKQKINWDLRTNS